MNGSGITAGDGSRQSVACFYVYDFRLDLENKFHVDLERHSLTLVRIMIATEQMRDLKLDNKLMMIVCRNSMAIDSYTDSESCKFIFDFF